ncbi:AtpZ/AtpI family protein [Arsenicicoccus dermatophilus]|uniref:AtpZ/AtpI family protein n=1 Tax=Arsenicicoccus dermatophilus TaxID=1076331 RepID=UPI001F4C586C|nr:AtpZ/AtpI family protein [Arsenicicoccus dermatophilus]MCH8612351.1 AtpZ/AtpI family protein [Arsenicicoccus dermatophilus]
MLPDSQGRPADGADHEGRVDGDRRTQDALAQSTASDVTAYLLAGPASFGLLGYGLDRWLGSAVGVPAGILLGLALSLYIVWVRYGRP